MRKLIKWLESNADSKSEAKQTYSRYFTFNNIKIRISDHYSVKEDCDIQIISPTNNSTDYVMYLTGSYKMAIMKTSDLLNFIPQFVLASALLKPSFKAEINTNTENYKWIKSKIQQSFLLSPIQKAAYTHTEGRWPLKDCFAVPSLLEKEFGFNKYFNKLFSTFLTTHNLSYEEVINMYNYIVVKCREQPTALNIAKAYKLVEQHRSLI